MQLLKLNSTMINYLFQLLWKGWNKKRKNIRYNSYSRKTLVSKKKILDWKQTRKWPCFCCFDRWAVVPYETVLKYKIGHVFKKQKLEERCGSKTLEQILYQTQEYCRIHNGRNLEKPDQQSDLLAHLDAHSSHGNYFPFLRLQKGKAMDSSTFVSAADFTLHAWVISFFCVTVDR